MFDYVNEKSTRFQFVLLEQANEPYAAIMQIYKRCFSSCLQHYFVS